MTLRGGTHGAIRNPEENRSVEFDVPVVVLALLGEAEADDGAGVAVEILSVGRAGIEPVPSFVAFANAAGESDVAKLDGRRILREGGKASARNTKQANNVFNGLSISPDRSDAACSYLTPEALDTNFSGWHSVYSSTSNSSATNAIRPGQNVGQL